MRADVKFLPLMHHDVAFLFRKLLRRPMRQPLPCSGSVGCGLIPFTDGETEAQEGRGMPEGKVGQPPSHPTHKHSWNNT